MGRSPCVVSGNALFWRRNVSGVLEVGSPGQLFLATRISRCLVQSK